MKYKINKILPAQIEVEFENQHRAMVFINPDATPEEIDVAVSKYDSDFRPDPETLINRNISVGEERVSKQKIEEVEKVVEEDEEEFIPFYKKSLYGGLPLPSFHKDQIIISYVMADYFIEKYNDDTLKKELDKKVEEYILADKALMKLLAITDLVERRFTSTASLVESFQKTYTGFTPGIVSMTVHKFNT